MNWRFTLHIVLWAGGFIAWLMITRHHHPTLIIAASATAVLVASFALAVYANNFFLLPRFARQRLWLRYVLALLATVAVLDLIVVVLIQFIYDRLWGADPLRYGFWFNLMADGCGILVHVGAALAVMRFGKFLRRSVEIS